MTGDNVVSLKGAEIANERRDEFVARMAVAFDAYVKAEGYEPDAAVMILCGVRQTARTAYLIQGESQGCGSTILAFAHASLLNEFLNPEEEA